MCRERGTHGDQGAISIRGICTTSSSVVTQSGVISRSNIDSSLYSFLSSADCVVSNAMILEKGCVARVAHRA